MRGRYTPTMFTAAVIQMAGGLALGAAIFWRIAPWLAYSYVVLGLLSLFVCIRTRCSFCYYYGKTFYCALGILAPLLVGRGNPKRFGDPEKLWSSGLLSLSSLVLPLLAGAFLLITALNPLDLLLLAGYFLIGVLPGFVFKGKVYCKYCRQGEIGCPALEKMRGKKTGRR